MMYRMGAIVQPNACIVDPFAPPLTRAEYSRDRQIIKDQSRRDNLVEQVSVEVTVTGRCCGRHHILLRATAPAVRPTFPESPRPKKEGQPMWLTRSAFLESLEH